MAGVMDYHCPHCGGALAFDAELQKLKCPYCDSVFSPGEFQAKDDVLEEGSAGGSSGQTATDGGQTAASGSVPGQTASGGGQAASDGGQAAAPGSIPGQTASTGMASANQAAVQTGTQQSGGYELTFDGNSQWGDAQGEDLRVYSCPNCGAQVIADATTAATHCPYCNNVVVMEGQLSGDFKPDYVIPFQVKKEQAIEKFRQHINKSKYVPKVFSAQDHPEEIKGVYVPFWLFNADADVDMWFNAENIRMWTDRNYEYVETEYYELHRAGTIAMRHVPVDGSKKMADDLMESIEPFDFSKAVPFQTAYLAGFMADRYDVGYADCTDRANERMRISASETLRSTAYKYDRVSVAREHFDWHAAKITYALYPVWVLSTTWKGKNYLFAMNGQTGKFVGDLPLDHKAFLRFRLTLSIILSAIFFVLIFLGLAFIS